MPEKVSRKISINIGDKQIFIDLNLEKDITIIRVKGQISKRWHSSIPYSSRNKAYLEDEFKKRCVSIQNWVNSEYDTTLLPHDIAFPLLKKLSELEESITKNIFTQEIKRGLLSGESQVVSYLFVNYLDSLSQTYLKSIFNKENLDKFSNGVIKPYYLNRVKDLNIEFYKELLKGDINFYIKTEDYQIIYSLIRNEHLLDRPEALISQLQMEKLNNYLFTLLKEQIDYLLENHYYLEDVYEELVELTDFLVFRSLENVLLFFERFYTQLNDEQKHTFTSYLLLDQNDIQKDQFEKIKHFFRDLNWTKLINIILERYILHAYGSYKEKVRINEKTIDLLEDEGIPLLGIIFTQIRQILYEISLDYGILGDGGKLSYNVFSTLLANNPNILCKFLSSCYPDLNNEEKCLFIALFLFNKKSDAIPIESLKEKFEQLNSLQFSEVISNVMWYSYPDEYLDEKNLKKLEEIGIKILINIIMYSKFDFEYRVEIGKIATNIIKDHEGVLKDIITEQLIALIKANSYDAIVNLFNTEIIKLLNKDDVEKILRISEDKLLEIINKMFDEEYPPAYLEYILSKMGLKGGDLIFKFTQKHDYLDYVFGIMREKDEDIFEPFIKNVVINENDYRYGDWGYEFVEEFFKIFNKEQITRLFDNKELNLVIRLINSYFPSRGNQEIIIFLIRAYEHLDKDQIIKIHKKLTKKMKEEIEVYFHQAQDYGSSKIRKYNEILQLIGQQDEAFLDMLRIYEEFSSILLFGDLREMLKDKDFNLPKNMMGILSDIRILLEENKDLFSPEDHGCEDKNYIKDFFYEFEKFLQYIIFNYYATNIDEMLEQLAHFFNVLLVFNEIIQEEVENNFTYSDINKLKNENYEYYKRRGIFLKEPVWVEKHRKLYHKLFLKPHSYPSIRVRWWGEHWEKYITERDSNLKNEFAYYFAERKYTNSLCKEISLEIVNEKLFVKMKWNLPNTKKTALERLNDSSYRFKVNREEIIFGLSLPRNYYRECALEFLRKMDGNSSSKSINDFVKELSTPKQQEVIKNLIEALSQKHWKERELVAKFLGLIESKYKNMSYKQILYNLDKDSQALIITRLSDHFYTQSSNEKLDYEQAKGLVEGLIAINTQKSADALRGKTRYVDFQDLKKKINDFLDYFEKLKESKPKEEIYCKYPDTLKLNKKGIIGSFNLRGNFGHFDKITNVRVSQDGKYIITAAVDNTIRIWDLKTGSLLNIFESKVYRNSLITLQNRQHIIFCSRTSPRYQEIKEMDIQTGDLVKTVVFENALTVPYKIGMNKVVTFTIKPDIGFEIRDYDSGDLIQEIKGKFDESISFVITPDEKTLIYSTSSLDIDFIDLKTNTILHRINRETSYGLSSGRPLALTYDGKKLITTYHLNHLKIWDVENNSLIKNIVAHSELITSIIISPDDKYAITASRDRIIKVWDLNTLNCVIEFKEQNYYEPILEFTPNGEQLIVAYSKHLDILDISNGKKIFSSFLKNYYGKHSNFFLITPDGKKMINTFNLINIWEINTGKLLLSVKDHSGISSIVISGDSKYIISGSKDWSIKVWDLETGKLISTFNGHKHEIRKVAISKDNSIVATSSVDGTIRLWDFQSGEILHTFGSLSKKLNSDKTWEQYHDTVDWVLISPNMRYIAGGPFNKKILIWDYQTKKELFSLDIYGGRIETMHFIKEDKYLITSAWTLIEIWDLETGKLVRTLGLMTLKDIFQLENKKTILCGTKSGNTILLFDLDANRAIGTIDLPYRIVNTRYIANTHSLLVHCDGDNIFIWDFSSFLENLIQKAPIPIKRRQYFAEYLYREDIKFLQLIGKDIQLEEIEGLDKLNDLKTLKANNFSTEMLNKFGGLDRNGNANSPKKIINYYKTIKRKHPN